MGDCNHRYPYILCHNCTCTHMVLYVKTCRFIDSTFLVIILVPPSSHCMLRSEIVLLTIANWAVHKTHTMSTKTQRGDVKNCFPLHCVQLQCQSQGKDNLHCHYTADLSECSIFLPSFQNDDDFYLTTYVFYIM